MCLLGAPELAHVEVLDVLALRGDSKWTDNREYSATLLFWHVTWSLSARERISKRGSSTGRHFRGSSLGGACCAALTCRPLTAHSRCAAPADDESGANSRLRVEDRPHLRYARFERRNHA